MARPKKTTKTAAALSDSGRLINEMVAGGASKSRIGEKLGTSLMTIMSVATGKTAKFRKEADLKRLFEKWKAGKVDLKGQRGKKAKVAVPVKALKQKTAKTAVKFSDFPLPEITDQMISQTEKEIASLTLKLQYMKDVKAIQNKYST